MRAISFMAFYSNSMTAVLLFISIVSSGQKTIAFASDTQAPMWVERIVLPANHNKLATEMIFHDIISQKPSSLFILGDVVTLGYKEKKWEKMDRYLDSCRKAGIHVSALLGNHDVMTHAKKGESKFQKRFPNNNRTGFYEVTDSIAVVFLNSNFKKLSADDKAKQQSWFKSTLRSLDNDPSVRTTIVTCHHAPFSNSKIVGSSESVQKHFVPDFLLSSKAKLFITGHSHNFEQFQHSGKHFLIIGGGGGLRQPLSSSEGRLNDLSGDYKPEFHYLLVNRSAKALHLTSRFVTKDFSGLDNGLVITIPIE